MKPEHKSKEDEILGQVFDLVAQGGRKQLNTAALLLDKHLTGRVTGYFVRHKVSPDAAEELTNDLWLKLITSRFEGRTRPVVWMWTLARSMLFDWHRVEAAAKRGKNLQASLDEDDWLALMESRAGVSVPTWIRLCIERAMWQMEQDDPARAEVLRMVFEGWTDIEIAIYYGADPDTLTDKQRGAARDRSYQARKRARDYFADCKE